MTNASAKLLTVAVFTLVPAAYLSMPFWRPAAVYGSAGREIAAPMVMLLMLAVLVVSLLSWGTYRLLAALGLLACLLWLCVTLLPVL
jgi:hypothetical protein